MRRSLTIPRTDGEALLEPPIAEWEVLARRTAAAAATWSAKVGGMPLSNLRKRAREEALRLAEVTCRRLGIAFDGTGGAWSLIVMTGHQPELFHPGVWAKHFAVQRFADEIGATPLEVVVDSDRCGRLSLRTPCVCERVRRHDVVLVDGGDSCYGCLRSPAPEAVKRFAAEAATCAQTLPDSELSEHLMRFIRCLEQAAAHSETLAEAVVAARRSYEVPASTRYGELFMTEQAASSSFRRFTAQLMCDSERFAVVFNEEVRAYRTRKRLRSAAHPFPELSLEGGVAEVPVWALVGGLRRRVAFEPATARIHVEDHGVIEAGTDVASVYRALVESGVQMAPRAVALTMFERLCVADLFVHGVGGSRYESITDRVIERWLGIVPPPYAVVSLTMRLSVGSTSQIDHSIAKLRHTLHVAKHNPDRLLDEVTIDPSEREEALALIEQKRRLVAQAAEPGADKRSVGTAIRQVNAQLQQALAPMVATLEAEIERLEHVRGEHEVLSDRECSFPLFDPLDVMRAVG